MRAVAGAIGISSPSIYLHFEDKDSLIQEVCDRRFGELNSALDAAGSQSTDPLESLRLRGAAYVRFGVENPEHYRVLMMTKTDDPRDDFATTDNPTQGDTAFAHLVDSVVKCIEAGSIKQMDPLVASLALWAGVHGLTSLMISVPNYPWPEDMVGQMLDSHLLGLAPR